MSQSDFIQTIRADFDKIVVSIIKLKNSQFVDVAAPVADETLAQHINTEWSFSMGDIYRKISTEIENGCVFRDDVDNAFVKIDVFLEKVVKPDASKVARELLVLEIQQMFEKCQVAIKSAHLAKECDEQTMRSLAMELAVLSKEFRKIK